jgi:hypothetical protein
VKRDGYLRSPSAKERRDLARIYGAPIVIDGFDYAEKPRRIPGLVIHLVENRQGIRDYIGDENLFDGRSALYRRLLDNKWAEYKVVSAIDATVMPKSILASEIFRRPRAKKITRENVTTLLEFFFARVQREFPKGAFVKYIREYGTREREQLIHTPEADARALAEFFVCEYKKYRSTKKIRECGLSAVQLVYFLLHDPTQIMVQEKLNISETRDAVKAEVRVDFCSLGPIIANLRWSYDVDNSYNQRAFEFFKRVWSAWPPELKKQFGGADVVFLKNGSMKIIEFNFGGESGFMDATQLIIPGNLFVSKILGRPTPLIAYLERLVQMSTTKQIAELTKLYPRTKRDDETHYSIRDLHLGDVWIYLRDRLVEEWMQRPSAADARRLHTRLQRIARSQQARVKDEKTRKLFLDMAHFGYEAMLEFLAKRRKNNSWPESKRSEQLSIF